MQSRISYLEQTSVAGPVSFFTCYIETPFDGTFVATEPTETAARANVLQRCSRRMKNNLFCSSNHVKCGR